MNDAFPQTWLTFRSQWKLWLTYGLAATLINIALSALNFTLHDRVLTDTISSTVVDFAIGITTKIAVFLIAALIIRRVLTTPGTNPPPLRIATLIWLAIIGHGLPFALYLAVAQNPNVRVVTTLGLMLSAPLFILIIPTAIARNLGPIAAIRPGIELAAPNFLPILWMVIKLWLAAVPLGLLAVPLGSLLGWDQSTTIPLSAALGLPLLIPTYNILAAKLYLATTSTPLS